MNKYYTPEISEFYSGFEFEYSYIDNENDFITVYEEKVYKLDGSWFNVEEDLQEEIDCGRIRVKYLDKQDIESLGWECRNFSDRRIVGYKYVGLEKFEDGSCCDSKLTIHMRNNFNSKTPHITIREYESHDPEEEMSIEQIDKMNKEVIFRGYVKNVSEFKKLLKQLNIDE